MQLMAIFYSIIYIPVSYTHLDVYKRQNEYDMSFAECRSLQSAFDTALQNSRTQKDTEVSTGRHSGNCLLPGTGYADGRKHTHLQCILL